MDFRSRGAQPQNTNTQPAQQGSGGNGSGFSTSSFGGKKGNMLERGLIVMLIAGALLIGALAFLLNTGTTNGQSRAVDKTKYQAVFLNNGQVYFGNIKTLGGKFIDLQNIYYLQTNGGASNANTQATDNSNVSLVKLGCELHAPFDQMIINQDQVIFWENLQDSSQVVKAIAEYKKQNPKGQTCSTQSQNSTQQAPSTGTPAPATPSGAAAPTAPAAGTGTGTAAPRATTRP
ncbi:MAG TPA: hypothetical protein VK983_03855 [Candidatus Limnocylindrales bacterium]|nr:hypothetical protein [Candidatus Limnocylindrales bacterium]